jgi:hypothetical protein
VASVEQIPNLRPGLAHLASLRARLFPRKRPETSQIEFIGRRLSHGKPLYTTFQKFYKKYPKRSGTFRRISIVAKHSGMFQEISIGFGNFQF